MKEIYTTMHLRLSTTAYEEILAALADVKNEYVDKDGKIAIRGEVIITRSVNDDG